MFAIPWGDRTYIGTTDTDYQEDPSDVAASSNDVDYLIEASNYYFSDNPLNRGDVILHGQGFARLSPKKSDGEDGSNHPSHVSTAFALMEMGSLPLQVENSRPIVGWGLRSLSMRFQN